MSGRGGNPGEPGADYLGTGWAFPVDVDARGRIAMARREADIEQAMRIILLTPKGQRPMRPDFGCDIHELLFAPNNATTSGLAAYYVERALGMWEPRIEVKGVRARPDRENPNRMLIEIDYEIKASYDSRTLVFPFYRIPGEPGLNE
jgi:phage baseplate assembly protein W